MINRIAIAAVLLLAMCGCKSNEEAQKEYIRTHNCELGHHFAASATWNYMNHKMDVLPAFTSYHCHDPEVTLEPFDAD